MYILIKRHRGYCDDKLSMFMKSDDPSSSFCYFIDSASSDTELSSSFWSEESEKSLSYVSFQSSFEDDSSSSETSSLEDEEITKSKNHKTRKFRIKPSIIPIVRIPQRLIDSDLNATEKLEKMVQIEKNSKFINKKNLSSNEKNIIHDSDSTEDDVYYGKNESFQTCNALIPLPILTGFDKSSEEEIIEEPLEKKRRLINKKRSRHFKKHVIRSSESELSSDSDESSSNDSREIDIIETEVDDTLVPASSMPLVIKSSPDSEKENAEGITSQDEPVETKKRLDKNLENTQIVDSSVDSEKDQTSRSQNSKGRRDIRKILTDLELKTETKQANMLEEERIKRVKRKNEALSEVISSLENNDPNRLILDFDIVNKMPIVEVDPRIANKLKQHQREGVKFMWDCAIESVKQQENGHESGCILAHCMGLGKTFQVVAFIHTLLTNPLTKDRIKKALIIVPLNTLINWEDEFDMWLGEKRLFSVFIFSEADNNFHSRFQILERFYYEGGVLILGYEQFRSLLLGKMQDECNESQKKKVYASLLDPGADIVVVDEAHVLKNEKSQLNKTLNMIRTLRRIALTGTPLQNNLIEYHVMLHFVKPNFLGSRKEFCNRFVNPINNGQHVDSNEKDVKLMKEKTFVLNKMIRGCVQRFDYEILRSYLKEKFEYTLFIKATDLIAEMYSDYLDKQKNKLLLCDASKLIIMANHPWCLCHMAKQRSKSKQKTDKSIYIENETVHYNEREIDNVSGEISWFLQFREKINKDDIEQSGKLSLLFSILEKCILIGDKLIVVSQFLSSLDLIEYHLQSGCKNYLKSCESLGISSKWVKNVNYFRIDGTVDINSRKSSINSFNNPNNKEARLFLLSNKAGGIGINLIGANRCIIFDVSWNPTNDMQALFRIYRFGQMKPVYIYRFVTKDTIEEKMYMMQILKLGLSKRVIDKQNVARHCSKSQIEEIYSARPKKEYERSMLPPNDKLLGDLILSNNKHIVDYKLHDSLLEEKPDEDLTEEDRALAWTKYQNERDEEIRIEEEQRKRQEAQKKLTKEMMELEKGLLDEQARKMLDKNYSQDIIPLVSSSETNLSSQNYGVNNNSNNSTVNNFNLKNSLIKSDSALHFNLDCNSQQNSKNTITNNPQLKNFSNNISISYSHLRHKRPNENPNLTSIPVNISKSQQLLKNYFQASSSDISSLTSQKQTMQNINQFPQNYNEATSLIKTQSSMQNKSQFHQSYNQANKSDYSYGLLLGISKNSYTSSTTTGLIRMTSQSSNTIQKVDNHKNEVVRNIREQMIQRLPHGTSVQNTTNQLLMNRHSNPQNSWIPVVIGHNSSTHQQKTPNTLQRNMIQNIPGQLRTWTPTMMQTSYGPIHTEPHSIQKGQYSNTIRAERMWSPDIIQKNSYAESIISNQFMVNRHLNSQNLTRMCITTENQQIPTRSQYNSQAFHSPNSFSYARSIIDKNKLAIPNTNEISHTNSLPFLNNSTQTLRTMSSSMIEYTNKDKQFAHYSKYTKP